MAEITPADPNAEAATWMRRVERRLDQLERRQTLTNAAFSGRTRLLAADGSDRVILGHLGDDSYGVQVLDENDDTVFRADEGGMVAPQLLLPVYALAPVSVSGASGTPWRFQLPEVRSHDAIRALVEIQNGSASTYRARLHFETVFGGVSRSGESGWQNIGSGSSATYEWNWAPNWDGQTVAVFTYGGHVALEIERLTGANALSVSQPFLYLTSVDAIDATSDGL